MQPVDQLLDDRGFDFGDEYPRSSLTAFGTDNRLQCLPYGVQPSVIFYNKRLVKLGQIDERPADARARAGPSTSSRRPARWAVEPPPGRRRHLRRPDPDRPRAVRVLRGRRSSSTTQPTRPRWRSPSDANQQSLIQTVRVLHAPGLDADPGSSCEKHTPLEWFERGKLALLEGSRRMVPELRAALGSRLRRDADARASARSATVGGLTGLCLSQHAERRRHGRRLPGLRQLARRARAGVASAGYLQPANQTVALSDAFQQPGRLPQHASVFTFSVKSMVYPPVVGRSRTSSTWPSTRLLDEMLRGRPSAEVPRDDARDRPRVVPGARPASSAPSAEPSPG